MSPIGSSGYLTSSRQAHSTFFSNFQNRKSFPKCLKYLVRWFRCSWLRAASSSITMSSGKTSSPAAQVFRRCSISSMVTGGGAWGLCRGGGEARSTPGEADGWIGAECRRSSSGPVGSKPKKKMFRGAGSRHRRMRSRSDSARAAVRYRAIRAIILCEFNEFFLHLQSFIVRLCSRI